ncbi:MAG: hypothetical protein AAF570_04215 [Bacteroidota bacterium]
MKNAFYTLFALLLTATFSMAQDDYKVLKTKADKKKHIRVDVLIPKKLLKKDYNALAETVKNGLDEKYKKTVVHFFLDGTGPEPFCSAIIGMEKKSMSSRVNGLPLEREANFIDESKTPDGATRKGRWLDEHKGTFIWWYEQGDEMTMAIRETLVKSAKVASTKLVTVTIGGEDRYMMRDADPHLKPYYILQDDGAIGYYEQEKLVRVFSIR